MGRPRGRLILPLMVSISAAVGLVATSPAAPHGPWRISDADLVRPGPGRTSSAQPGELPRTESVVEPDSTYVIFSHEFENAESNDCDARGWTAEERGDLVFVHVDNEFLQNDGFITMGTKALWFGCDLTSHPAEVAKWFYPYGFGFAWSQRATSPVLSSVGNYRLEFDGRIGLDTTTTIVAATKTTGGTLVHRFLTVQISQPGGGPPWIDVPARWVSQGIPQVATSNGIRGRGSFKCFAPLAPESLGFAPGTNVRVRIIVNTGAAAGASNNEDGSLPPTIGAAVIDNIHIWNLSSGPPPTDVILPENFESGPTAWELSARNGGLGGFTRIIRDVPVDHAQPALVRNAVPGAPGCVWRLAGPDGYWGNGSYARLTSPWFPRPPMPLQSYRLDYRMTFPLGINGQYYFFRFRVRGKNAGDAYAGRYNLRQPVLYQYDVEGAFLEDSEVLPLLGQTAGTVFCDSLQVVIEIDDQMERWVLQGFPPTRTLSVHPMFDRLGVSQRDSTLFDSDFDGIADSLDACPTVSAAGQDVDGNGCRDLTSTMRHDESWRTAPIHFRLSQNGDPLINDGSDLQALLDAFASWSVVPGSSLTLVDDGTTPQTDARATDGINLLTFEDDYAFPPNVLAITPTLSFTKREPFDDVMRLPGEIVDADIIFNPAVKFRTATAGPPTGSWDLRSVAAHEIGHLLGIGHSGVADATMYPVLQAGTLGASLASDDETAVAAAYPSGTLFANYAILSGALTRGSTGNPIPGALVMAVLMIGPTPVDTVASDYTDETGIFRFFRLPPGNYAVRIAPLDGSIPGVVPGAINQRIAEIAETNFKPEWYGGPESATDDPDIIQTVAVSVGSPATANLISNIDATPPTVASVSPANGTTGARIDTPILVTFDESVQASTLVTAFKLRPSGGSNLGGHGQLLTPGLSFVFIPDQPLSFSTTYVIELTTALRDIEGNPLASNHVTTFTTEPQPPVSIGNVSPREGPAGALLTLTGTGYDPPPGVENRVYFSTAGGFAGYVLGTQVTPTTMVVVVPGDAVSGPIKVSVSGDESNLFTFTLLTSSVEAPSPNGDAVAAGFQLNDVALAPEAGAAYATGDSGFVRVNLNPLLPFYRVARITSIGRASRLALTPNGLRAFVTQPDSMDIVELDADPGSGTYGQPLATIAIPGSPDGLVLSPNGRRAYATDQLTDVVYEVDIDPTSVTHRRLLREIRVTGAFFTGGVGYDPKRNRLIAATSNLGVVSVDLDTTSIVTVVSAAPGAEGLAVTPNGSRVLATAPGVNAGSFVACLPLGGPVSNVEVGGEARDLSVRPDGATAFIANADLDLLQVVDITQPVPRLVANVSTGRSPVAVAVSASGDLVATANRSDGSIGLYGVSATVTPLRAVPAAAMPGDVVAIATSGGTLPANSTVDLGPVALTTQSNVNQTASGLAVRVPAMDARPAAIAITTPAPMSSRTLSIPFDVVSRLTAFDPRATALSLDPVNLGCLGFDGALEQLCLSPDGEMLAVVRQGVSCARVDVYQVEPDATHLLGTRLLNSVPIGATSVIHDVGFTPDSRGLWVAGNAGGLFELNVDSESPGFGTSIPFGGPTVGTARSIATDPLGRYVLVGAEVTPGVHRVQLWNPNRTLSSSVVAATPVLDLAVTPDGKYALGGGFVNLASATVVAPLDSAVSIAVATDGRTAAGLYPGNRIAMWNLDPAAGAVGAIWFFSHVNVATFSQLLAAPNGTGFIAGCEDCPTIYRFERPPVPWSGTTPLPQLASASLGQPSRALARSPDGRTLWVANWNASLLGAVTAFTFTDGQLLGVVSGENQGAPPLQTLPQPVRVHLVANGGQDASGALVRFSLTSAAHGSIDGGLTEVVKPTDMLGEAEVSWTMPAAGGQVVLNVAALGAPGAAVTIEAEVVLDESVALPAVVDIGPTAAASNVNAVTEVFIRFSQRMDTLTVASGVTLQASGLGTIPCARKYDDDYRIVLLKPTAPLPYGALCTLTLTTAVADLQGQFLPVQVTSSFIVQAAPVLAVRSVTPPSASPGSIVTINGEGFSPIPSVNVVTFAGNDAPVTDATEASLMTSVPGDAVSGTLTVTVGTDSAAVPFTVLSANPQPLTLDSDYDAREGIEDIEITPDGKRAYITLPAANSVLAFDIPMRKVLAAIPVGRRPEGIAILPDGKLAYVANNLSDNVTAIDIDPQSPTFNHVLASPFSPIKVGDGPTAIAVSAFGPVVMVLNSEEGTLSIVDAASDLGTFNRVTATVPIGGGGGAIEISPDGTRVYISTAAGITIVDVASRAVTASVPIGGGGGAIEISPDGTLLFVIGGNGTLNLIDISPGSATYNKVVSSVPIGGGGGSVEISPDGTLLYLTLTDLDVTRIFKIIEGTSGGSGSSVIPGPIASLQLLASVDVGGAPQGVAVLPDRSAALVVNQNSGTITLLRPGNTGVETPVPAGPILSLSIHPTPSVASASLEFTLPSRSEVRLSIFDVQGRLVKELAHRRLEAGPHVVRWTGDHREGGPVGAGIYFARLEADGQWIRRRIVWLR